jgi:taurine dioxygenase
MKFELKPISTNLGVEISGLDLSKPVDAQTQKQLYDLWLHYAVMVVRNQKLEPPQFASAAQLFGDILQQQVVKFPRADPVVRRSPCIAICRRQQCG